ncbi:MAG: hypothetical protein LBF93_07175 [Zoogloeaceae bacterium]|jgi:Zn finger protein HypA/HybF involved in hydrogenase expression|nr:hypothetical protein [Zoogloeaceae bacterium]
MSNRKHVCFKCRTAVRREATSEHAVLCPSCGAEAVNLGYKIPIPPKSKEKEWSALEKQIAQEAAHEAEAARLKRVQRIHSLEKKIKRIESLPSNIGRQSLIKQLKQELECFSALAARETAER